MINVPPACPHGDTHMQDVVAAQAQVTRRTREYHSHCLASANHQDIKTDTIKRKRSVRHALHAGEYSASMQGQANPHPHSIVMVPSKSGRLRGQLSSARTLIFA